MLLPEPFGATPISSCAWVHAAVSRSLYPYPAIGADPGPVAVDEPVFVNPSGGCELIHARALWNGIATCQNRTVSINELVTGVPNAGPDRAAGPDGTIVRDPGSRADASNRWVSCTVRSRFEATARE